MATFKAQIEDYIGSFSDTSALDAWLTHAARLIIHLMSDNKAEKFTKELTDGGSGISVEDYRPLWAHKSGYRAVKFPADMKAQLSLSGSIYKATATSPAWYIELLKAYIIPSGGSVVVVPLPIVVSTMSSITLFPNEYKHGIVLYAAIQGLLQQLNDLTQTTLGGMTFTNPANIIPPSAPSFTWTDATGTIINLSAVDATTLSASTTLSVGNTLSFTPPAFGGSYTAMDTALGNADIEYVKGYVDKVNSQLNQFGTDFRIALSDFDKEAKQFELDLQEAIAQAQITSQETIRQADITLQEARAQAEIDAKREDSQASLTQNLKLQNELNDYKQDVEEYQADLGKYQINVANFVAQVQKEVQRITTLTQKHLGQHSGMLAQFQVLKSEYEQILEMVKRG